MRSISNRGTLDQLLERLERLRPDTPRKWGTMTPAEMLCHLGDSAAAVLARPGGQPGKRRAIIKWLALRSPFQWRHGVQTAARVDPRRDGSRPGDFERDRDRAANGLRALAAAGDGAFPAAHMVFGAMTTDDWKCWAWRHTDHHLRQFGL